MKLALVAAVAENCVIGADGAMPWHYPEDLRRFKELTLGQPVIMGRTTYESIERRLDGPLPGRTNIVLSRQSSLDLPEGVFHASGIDDAIEIARESLGADQETVYVIGGATIYEQFLGQADELAITEIPESPAGDTHFPEIGSDWTEIDREVVGELEFVTYRR